MANESKAVAKPRKESRFHPIRYFKEVIGELKKLTWPTGKELVSNTGAVLAFLLVAAVTIGVLDLLFSQAVKLLASL